MGPLYAVHHLQGGGVGPGAIQAARIGGAAHIIAVDPVPHRRDDAAALGATAALDPTDTSTSTDDLIAAIMAAGGQRGVDVAIEAVGEPDLATDAFSTLAPGGQAVIVGMMPQAATSACPHRCFGTAAAWPDRGPHLARHPAYMRMVTGGHLAADELATSCWPLEEVNTTFEHAAGARKRGICR